MCNECKIMNAVFSSNSPKAFWKKDILENFANSTGKHQCQSLFFNKVEALSPVTLLKKRLQHRCFPMDFAKYFGVTF